GDDGLEPGEVAGGEGGLVEQGDVGAHLAEGGGGIVADAGHVSDADGLREPDLEGAHARLGGAVEGLRADVRVVDEGVAAGEIGAGAVLEGGAEGGLALARGGRRGDGDVHGAGLTGGEAEPSFRGGGLPPGGELE